MAEDRDELFLHATGLFGSLAGGDLLGELALLVLETLVVLVKDHDRAHLGADDLRLERLRDEVDGAELVAATHGLAIVDDRGHEHHREVAQLLARANRFDGPKSVEDRHRDIHEHERPATLGEIRQRLGS